MPMTDIPAQLAVEGQSVPASAASGTALSSLRDEAPDGASPSGLQSADAVAELIRPTLDKFVAGAEPYLRKVTEDLYEQLLNTTQDYLRENGEWNIGQEITRCRQIERDNMQLRIRNDALTNAVRLLEGANEALCAKRSAATYESMLMVDGAQLQLERLDEARRHARNELAKAEAS